MEDVSHPANVVRSFDITFHQSADIFPTKLRHEVAVLKNYVLSSAILWWRISFMISATLITWRVEDEGKISIVGVSLYFLDNRHAGIGLLVQNDCLKSKVFDEATDLDPREIISSVNDENLPFISGDNWRRSSKWSWP